MAQRRPLGPLRRPEVVKAWMASGVKAPRTIHHRGYGAFMVAGETIKLPSRMP